MYPPLSRTSLLSKTSWNFNFQTKKVNEFQGHFSTDIFFRGTFAINSLRITNAKEKKASLASSDIIIFCSMVITISRNRSYRRLNRRTSVSRVDLMQFCIISPFFLPAIKMVKNMKEYGNEKTFQETFENTYP